MCCVGGGEGEIGSDEIGRVDKRGVKRKIGDLNLSEIKRLGEVFEEMLCE